ncbi:MAG: hypothetical protein WBB39_03205 [Candidatus Saccharimonadales bacterium]
MSKGMDQLPGIDFDGAWRRHIEENYRKNGYDIAVNIRAEWLPQAAYTTRGSFLECAEQLLNVGRSDKCSPTDIRDTWTGAISLNSIRQNGVKIDTLPDPKNLSQYYVVCSPYAPTRCIDGRGISQYGESPYSSADRLLGAQVPGGTAMAALSARVAAWGTVYTDDFSLAHDITILDKTFCSFGMRIGGHIDERYSEDITGCGAIDMLPAIIERVTQPTAQKQVRKLAQLIMGDTYDSEITDAVVGRLTALQGLSDEYLAYDRHSNTYGYRHEAISSIRRNSPYDVSQLCGPHREAAFVINLVPHTTFHVDQFTSDNGGEVSIFNYDFWRSLLIAEKLYPANSNSSSDEKDIQSLLRKRYITSRALLAVATCMVLTDGSQELMIRELPVIGKKEAVDNTDFETLLF